MKTKLILMAIILIGLSACIKNGKETPEQKEPVVLTINHSTQKMVAASSNFGINLTNKIAELEKEKDNWMISPLSVTLALAMTYNGADGETKKAMERTLKLEGLDINEINSNFKDLVSKLLSVDKRVDIAIANSIWYRNGFSVIPDFLDINKTYYDAQVRALDFSKTAAKDIINQWVADNTKNKIKTIVNQISPETVMFLINAIYFKGIWKNKFDPKDNYKAPFYLKDGNSKEVEMMKCEADFRGFIDTEVQLVEMPYGQGNWVIDLIIPNDKTPIDEFMKNLSADKWNKWINGLSTASAKTVIMPPFKFEYSKELKECLQQLGMGVAFGNGADFTKINSNGELCISKVKHKTFIELNEKGTEAAAVTSVSLIETSGGVSHFVIFDKPFMFAIREISTNTIAFIGKMGNPKR